MSRFLLTRRSNVGAAVTETVNTLVTRSMRTQAKTRFTFGLMVSAALCPAVSVADLAEFNLAGHVTQSNVPLIVTAGEPFAVKFVADAADRVPSDPIVGIFDIESLIVEFPRTTLVSVEPFGVMRINLGSGGDALQISHSVRTHSNDTFGIDCILAFPPHSFASDALPLEVPLSHASFNRLTLARSIEPNIAAPIGSYAGQPLPEPAVTALVLSHVFTVAVARRRRCSCACHEGILA
jgi:hypothetical protein